MHEALILHDDKVLHGLMLVDVDHADYLSGFIVHGSIGTILCTESRTAHVRISFGHKLEQKQTKNVIRPPGYDLGLTQIMG